MTLIIINGYGISTVNPKLEDLENVYEHLEVGIRSLASRDFYNMLKEVKTIAELQHKVRELQIKGLFRVLYLETIEQLYRDYVNNTEMAFETAYHWEAYRTALKQEEDEYARYKNSSGSDT